MEDTKTIEAKHIFIDIVDYTHKRSVEAQTDIIKVLNDLVNESIDQFNIDKTNVIFIPTGDGMCISLINIVDPYDIHLQIGIELLKKLSLYNDSQESTMRKFAIRIGINENIDNLIIDINGRTNISGSGINMASRIEGLADNNQILVGHSVYDKLINREKYMESFASYSAIVKHGLSLSVYQYRNTKLDFLNSNTPSAFQIKAEPPKKLTTFEGYYIANCILNESFITSKVGSGLNSSALHSFMYLLTLDSIGQLKITKTNPTYVKRVAGTNDDFFKELMNANIWLCHEIQHSLLPIKLKETEDCFSEAFLFVNDLGKKRLRDEMPEVFSKLNLK